MEMGHLALLVLWILCRRYQSLETLFRASQESFSPCLRNSIYCYIQKSFSRALFFFVLKLGDLVFSVSAFSNFCSTQLQSVIDQPS